MRLGVLGSGTVGTTLAAAFAGAGHDVVLGTGHPDRAETTAWSEQTGVPVQSFASAAEHGEVVVNATAGVASVALLTSVAHSLDGTVVVDVANPLDFSAGFPPSLTVGNTDSLAEQIQQALPRARVVKALNTVTAAVMVAPGQLPQVHHLPIAGNDPQAKATVVGLLGDLGWPSEAVLDLGEIQAARGTEAYLLLWVRLLGAVGSPMFNIRVVRADGSG